jgi:2-haloalkanoic acid dehalogenase type II
VNIRAVLFDYFFTLADPEVHAVREVATVLARHESDADPAEVWAAWRGRRIAAPSRPLDGEVPPFERFWDHWHATGGEFLEEYGITDGHASWADCRRDAHCVAPVYDDVAPALDALRDDGLRIGVLSDADTDFLLPTIELNGLGLDAVISSEQHGCYKPHRSFFLAGCALVDVSPEQAVYVGDTPRADILGARNAGMRTVWINRTGRPWPEDLEPADAEIRALDELRSVVARLGAEVSWRPIAPRWVS